MVYFINKSAIPICPNTYLYSRPSKLKWEINHEQYFSMNKQLQSFCCCISSWKGSNRKNRDLCGPSVPLAALTGTHNAKPHFVFLFFFYPFKDRQHFFPVIL